MQTGGLLKVEDCSDGKHLCTPVLLYRQVSIVKGKFNCGGELFSELLSKLGFEQIRVDRQKLLTRCHVHCATEELPSLH